MFEITRRDPFDRTVRSLMNIVNGEPFFRPLNWETEEGTLAVDVAERDGELLVRASLPGFKKEDIDVQIHDGVLSIKAEHSEVKETEDERYYRRERTFGSVSRRIALPGVIAEANVAAELKDGVLTLRIPQAEAAKPKRIAIK